uniref:Glyco_transf_64 domain-containing protein n=1 Tax=Strongyloides papillosus TaxID=174720 RepID=A0A0N5C8S0_STREA
MSKEEKNKTLVELQNKDLILKFDNFCKILSYSQNFESLVILLIATNCVPLINKDWIKNLPLIDNDHDWEKGILLVENTDFNNEKFLKNIEILTSDINQMKEYGKRLISWNFIQLSSISFNIIYFLEKFFTGINIERTIQAIPLYKEDEILFEKERLRKKIISNKYTVITLTYQNNQKLNLSLRQYDSIPFVDKVIIVWNNEDTKFMLEKNRWYKSRVPVFFVKTKFNSMNNRYLPYDIIKTECIFFLDEDIRITEKLLMKTFNFWKMNKNVIVGYYARYTEKGVKSSYVLTKTKSYNLILLGLSLIHRRYIYSYSYKMSSKIRNFVDETLNCDDIAFNFMVALFTNKPNILFTKGVDLSRCKKCSHHTGLYFRPDHLTTRGKCIDMFTNLYGMNPLIENEYYSGVY